MQIIYINGFIPSEKRWELEQTYQQVLLNKPRESLEFNLATDVVNTSLFFFVAIWPDKDSMQRFLHSPEYKLLIGAFQVLGFMQRSYVGELQLNMENHIADNRGDL